VRQLLSSPALPLPPPAAAPDDLSGREGAAALTAEGCTPLQVYQILAAYSPDPVRALLAQAAERRRSGERNGGIGICDL
jgi:hypothetical protein